ncbi:MAG: DNA internalization-related competence protein ComEC/Rec2 [Candidatus Aminicenantales bacterium]
MAYPVLFLTIALTAGIAAASALSLSLVPLLIVLGILLTVAGILYRQKKTSAAFIVLLAATVCLGAGVFADGDRRYEKNGLRGLPAGEYFDFLGTVDRSPAPGLERDHIFLRVESVAGGGRDRPVRGRLRVSVNHSEQGARLPDFIVGDRLRISAQVVAPSEYRNFAEPFSIKYLKTQNLHILGSAKSPLLVERLGTGRAFPPLRWISMVRRACLRRIERAFAAPASPGGISPEGAIFEALILGECSRMDADTTLALQKTGLYHLFAISGAHIALVSALLFFLFRLIRIPERPAYLLLLVLLVFYGFLVEGRASVVRAVIMAAAFIIGKLLWKDVHLLNTIALSAFVILYVRPFQLFDAGFQLTFAATVGLILFFPGIKSVLPKLPFKITELLALSIAAQIAVAPIIAITFHRMIFSGLILNLIGIPLVTVVMAAGYVFLPAVFLFPFLAGPAAAVLAFLLRLFLASTGLLDGLPFLSYRVPTPPGPVVFAYYAFLLLLLLPRRFILPRRIAALGFAAAFVVLATYPFSPAVKDLTVTVIDVGQGEAILVEFPGTSKMLVDGGGLPTGSFDIGENVVSPFLWSKGIKKIDRLVLTHPHPDHLNGLAAVARNFRIGEFWEGTAAPGDPRYLSLQKELAETVSRRRIDRGFNRVIGGVNLAVIAPLAPTDEGPPDNDSSIVLKLSYGSTAFLLTGDISRKIEEEILAAGIDVRAQVLKAAHHGSDSSSSEAFLAAVRPEYIVISAGRDNRSRLPHPDTLARFVRSGARILRTDLEGAVEFRSDGDRLSVRTSRRRQ